MKNTKQLMVNLTILLIVFVAVMLAFAFTACNNDTVHSCSFGEWETKTQATCIAKETQERTCSCGKKETQEVGEPLVHIWEFIEGTGQAPTCLDDGHGDQECTLCGEIKEDVDIDALGHSFTEYISNDNATCLENGTETAICDRCPVEDERTEEDTALGHDMKVSGEVTQAATCTEDGIGKKECERCDYTEPYGVINAPGHSFTTWSQTRPATCTVENQETRTCTRTCGLDGHTETRSTVAALGHTFIDNWGNSTATCTVAGQETRTCTLACDLTGHTETRPAAALGHSFTTWSETRPATCTVENQETRTCTRTCGLDGHTETQSTVAALGHNFNDWSQTRAATCTVENQETRTCTRTCGLDGHTETQSTVAALGHDFDWEMVGIKICKRNNCNANPALGDTGPAGGKIIYIAPSGFEVTSTTAAFTTYTAYYLEAAPANAVGGTGTQTSMRWSTQISSFPNVIGTSFTIGSGRNNTALIIAAEKAAYPSDTYIYAALACDNYSIAGFNDWFLPSRAELNQLYLRRADFGLSSGWFWSSSQDSSSTAWGQGFVNDDIQYGYGKSNATSVRAVRAF